MDASSSPPPREQIITGIQNNSIPDVRRAIETLRHSRKGFDPAWALTRAVKYAQPDMVRYLLESEGATVEGLGPFTVAAAAAERGEGEMERVERMWGVLVEMGWDVNVREGDDAALAKGESLLTLICDNDRLVHWLLSHGATTADPLDLDPFVTRPLLEAVASKGSVSTFSLLRDHGAQVTRRVLHRAVEGAAFAERERWPERMGMVRFLVEEMGCDVNGMDVEEGERKPNYWGTPAAYAVHGRSDLEDQVAEVVGYLLEKGANPTIKDCWGNYSVLSYAERAGNQKVLDVLKEWEKKREGSG